MAHLNQKDPANSEDLGLLPDVRMTIQINSLHVRRVKQGWTYPSHEHPIFEIHWMVEGEQQMVVDGSFYDQKKGDVLIIKPGVTHSCRPAGRNGYTYMSVHFSVDDRELLAKLNGLQDTYFSAASALASGITPSLSNLQKLACESYSLPQTAVKRMKVYAAVFDLLGALGEHFSLSEKDRTTQKERVAGRIAEQIEAAVRGTIIHGKADEDDRTWIHNIAKRFRISPSQLNRIFQSKYGKSPRRYMSEIMVQEAKRLLLQHDLPVDRVAVMLGYKNGAHFTRQFKRWTGLTPSSFRGQEDSSR